MYSLITFNEKFSIVHQLFPYDLRNTSKSLYQVLTLTDQTYMESLLNDESAHDGRSYNLYRVLTLTTRTCTESLLNEGSAPDDHFESLHQVPP